MYPAPVVNGEVRPEPNPSAIHLELRRTGVTLRLLHEEYLLANANANGYTNPSDDGRKVGGQGGGFGR
ncbi:MAG: hypothetical protein H0T79_08955 [Deltaproteobacteria bacterium]|nr:hypothetical protein [Deltaproteobacteria bacterium]